MLWKQRGLGESQPLFASTAAKRDGGRGGSDFRRSPLAGIGRYVHLNWRHLQQNKDGVREFFWAVRPLEWLAIAGCSRRLGAAWAKAALVSVWFAAFLVVKGTADQASIEDASFFRLLMPAFPAFVLLLAAVPLLVPKLSVRLSALWPSPTCEPGAPEPPDRLDGGADLSASSAPARDSPRPGQPAKVVNDAQHTLVPVSNAFHPSGTVSNGVADLSWQAPYKRLGRHLLRRAPRPAQVPRPLEPRSKRIVKRGVSCREQKSGAVEGLPPLHATGSRRRALVSRADRPPAKGRWDYRIGLAANWLNDPARGDVLLVSPAVTIDLR